MEGARGLEDPDISVMVGAATTLRKTAAMPTVEIHGGVDRDPLISLQQEANSEERFPWLISLSSVWVLVSSALSTHQVRQGTDSYFPSRTIPLDMQRQFWYGQSMPKQRLRLRWTTAANCVYQRIC
ncbi:hypothetical protein PoB_006331100 [Plakobranchus ocellatus]|uniref:Uncharacterized protein n=1 Tax=Plakobranchus ocellatus TaxID=259542 RepID=A0AAV4CY04_9GAST|nr:hypothetical protein PoB_006331100 [Plakobranchus ocellatus]